MKTSPATHARLRLGISLEEMAKRARLSSARYLRDIELHGCTSYDRALKLSRLYGCAPDLFRRRRQADYRHHGEFALGEFQGPFPSPPTATGADTSSTPFRCAGRGFSSQNISQRYRPRRVRETHLKIVEIKNQDETS